jgi:MFS transporter, ACS family, glucarate transporter
MSTTKTGRVRWILIIWMFVISAVSYLDRVNISIAGQFIQSELHLTSVQLGSVFSALVLGYALFQTPGGRLADRFGPRKVVALGTVWWGVFTALTAAVSPAIPAVLLVLLTVRFVLGAGEAVVYPASNRLVASWIPSLERGLANGWIFGGVGIGSAVAPPFVTYMVLHYGWRSSFWASALIGLAAGGIWFLLARDRPADHPWVGPEEAEHIRAGLPKPAAGFEHVKTVPWRTILTHKDVLALTFSYSCFGYMAYIFFTWFFIYLSRVRGLDLKSSSFYSMLPPLAIFTGSFFGGWIGDRLSKRYSKRVGRCYLAVLGLGLAAVFIALATQVADARFAAIVFAGGAGALYLSSSSFWAVSADLGGTSAGSVSGVMNMGCQLAGALTASLSPYLAEHFGWTASFLTAAVLCGIGSLTWLVVEPERRLHEDYVPAQPSLSAAKPAQ